MAAMAIVGADSSLENGENYRKPIIDKAKIRTVAGITKNYILVGLTSLDK